MSTPCWRCGANAWTSCDHREAEMEEPQRVQLKDYREASIERARFTMPGRHFKYKRGAPH